MSRGRHELHPTGNRGHSKLVKLAFHKTAVYRTMSSPKKYEISFGLVIGTYHFSGWDSPKDTRNLKVSAKA